MMREGAIDVFQDYVALLSKFELNFKRTFFSYAYKKAGICRPTDLYISKEAHERLCRALMRFGTDLNKRGMTINITSEKGIKLRMTRVHNEELFQLSLRDIYQGFEHFSLLELKNKNRTAGMKEETDENDFNLTGEILDGIMEGDMDADAIIRTQENQTE